MSSMWLAVTVMYILKKEILFTLLLVSGLVLVYILVRIFGFEYIIYIQIASIAVVSIIAMVIILIIFNMEEKKMKKLYLRRCTIYQ